MKELLFVLELIFPKTTFTYVANNLLTNKLLLKELIVLRIPMLVLLSSYHEELTHFLYSNGKTVSVVLANKIKHFAKNLNVKTKTDKTDASMIGAHYGLERYIEPWKPMMPFLLRFLVQAKK